MAQGQCRWLKVIQESLARPSTGFRPTPLGDFRPKTCEWNPKKSLN